MESLSQSACILKKIGTTSAKNIRTLHRLIFGKDGDRNNRSRLREFAGFQFDIRSEEYEEKLNHIRKNFKLCELVIACDVLCLNFEGDINEVSERILRSLCQLQLLENNAESEDENEDEANDEDDENAIEQEREDVYCVQSFHEDEVRPLHKENKRSYAFPIHFRDIEDSIRTFSGEEGQRVENWLGEFEENAVLWEWNELHKLIFAKKSLRGLARRLIQAERNVQSYSILKRILLEEFSTKVSSADVHDSLRNRRQEKDETIQDYFLKMRELASRSSVETDSLIQYVISGIADDNANKLLLYGAKNIAEFRSKLQDYEEMKKIMARNKQPANEKRYYGRLKDERCKRRRKTGRRKTRR